VMRTGMTRSAKEFKDYVSDIQTGCLTSSAACECNISDTALLWSLT